MPRAQLVQRRGRSCCIRLTKEAKDRKDKRDGREKRWERERERKEMREEEKRDRNEKKYGRDWPPSAAGRQHATTESPSRLLFLPTHAHFAPWIPYRPVHRTTAKLSCQRGFQIDETAAAAWMHSPDFNKEIATGKCAILVLRLVQKQLTTDREKRGTVNNANVKK